MILQIAICLKRELQRGTRQINDSTVQKSKERWQGKRMYRKFSHNLDEKLVDNEQSCKWLKFGDIKAEKGGKIVAA